MPWKPYQPNPDNITTGDCTIRAVCAVTGLDWKTAHTALCELARAMSDMPSTNRVWMFFGSLADGIHRIELSVDGLSVKAGAKVVPAGRTVGNWSQKWLVVQDKSTGYYTLRNMRSRMVLAIAGKAKSGAAVKQVKASNALYGFVRRRTQILP